jgi:hypothetical protein
MIEAIQTSICQMDSSHDSIIAENKQLKREIADLKMKVQQHGDILENNIYPMRVDNTSDQDDNMKEMLEQLLESSFDE